jgi:hypothetical protein
MQNCCRPCTDTIRFVTDLNIGPQTGMSPGQYTNIDGYRYINIFVRFSQQSANEPPIDLEVVFAFGCNAEMGSGHYVNLEQNLSSSQITNFIRISGSGTWAGSPENTSAYIVRLPVMGPFVNVFPFNRATVTRTVSVWAYVVS